jgi:hypothetical protein
VADVSTIHEHLTLLVGILPDGAITLIRNQMAPSMDHHAVSDSKINDITKEHPEHPAHPHSDNFKFADNDDHPGKAPNDDSKINDIAKEQPEHPAHPHSDNFKFADDDGSAHSGHATGKDKDISVQPSADPKIGDIAKEHPEHPAHPLIETDHAVADIRELHPKLRGIHRRHREGVDVWPAAGGADAGQRL